MTMARGEQEKAKGCVLGELEKWRLALLSPPSIENLRDGTILAKTWAQGVDSRKMG